MLQQHGVITERFICLAEINTGFLRKLRIELKKLILAISPFGRAFLQIQTLLSCGQQTVFQYSQCNCDSNSLLSFSGVTYFFKDRFFWEFDDRKMSVIQDSPKSSVHFWFESFCRNTPMPKPPPGEREPNSVDSSTSLFSSTITTIMCIILSLSFTAYGR